MGFDARIAELLACPSCGTRLTGAGCLACRVDYPSIGGIPWLMPEPRLALTEWRGRLHHLLTHYAAEATRQRAGARRTWGDAAGAHAHRARRSGARRPGGAHPRS